MSYIVDEKLVRRVLVIFIAFVQMGLYADTRHEIEGLISDDLRGNFRAIEMLAEQLPQNDRLAIYDSESTCCPILPAAINLWLGFGLGSYIIGDFTSGHIQLASDTVAWGILGYTLFLASPSGANVGMLQKAGLIMFLISKFFGMVAPFVFSTKQNLLLELSLGLDKLSAGEATSLWQATEKGSFSLALVQYF